VNSRLVRPHLELCRLYGPYRLTESALAKRQGDQALAAYASIGNASGHAQALWCLSDVLLFGNADEQAVSRQHAEAALEIMKRLKYPFGIARGYNYLANVALFERKAAEAAALWTETLAAARSVGFVLLESRTLMNLGVANEALGKRSLALKYYQESAGFSEALGSQLDAMRNQVNAASILVEYGDDPDEGFRMAQDSLPVIEKLVDKNFEVSARRVVAMYYRNVGRHEDALREFTRARDVARERDLEDRVTQMTLELARVRFEMEDYLGARDLLNDVEARGAGLDRVHARIERARVHARLGDIDAARSDLSNASREMKESGDVGTLPLLYGAGGEVEYEAGRLADARSQFDLAAQLWTDEDPPEAASVEARAYVGLIDGVRRQASATALEASLARARTMKWAALEARVRVFLARLDIDAGRFNDALRRLGDLPADGTRALGPELRAQVHYWRSLAMSRRGDGPGAAKETAMVQQSTSELRRLVTDAHWPRVLSRPEIRLITMSVGQ
jgi:tetratricopeptide (TPR) repeat protein